MSYSDALKYSNESGVPILFKVLLVHLVVIRDDVWLNRVKFLLIALMVFLFLSLFFASDFGQLIMLGLIASVVTYQIINRRDEKLFRRGKPAYLELGSDSMRLFESMRDDSVEEELLFIDMKRIDVVQISGRNYGDLKSELTITFKNGERVRIVCYSNAIRGKFERLEFLIDDLKRYIRAKNLVRRRQNQ